jgi:hypothetical protein
MARFASLFMFLCSCNISPSLAGQDLPDPSRDWSETTDSELMERRVSELFDGLDDAELSSTVCRQDSGWLKCDVVVRSGETTGLLIFKANNNNNEWTIEFIGR